MFEVSRSGYYEWRSKPSSQREQQDEALKARIREHHEEGRATYGSRRIQRKLAGEYKAVSRCRIARLMKEESLECKTRRKFKATTNSKHDKLTVFSTGDVIQDARALQRNHRYPAVPNGSRPRQ
ncbi:IS3 family transposase [Zobellella aerophila]|uniref:IS3 family transposase n=1 Tax=Zobellella aerophila TaxID=870480 RepID=UPI0031EEE819